MELLLAVCCCLACFAIHTLAFVNHQQHGRPLAIQSTRLWNVDTQTVAAAAGTTNLSAQRRLLTQLWAKDDEEDEEEDDDEENEEPLGNGVESISWLPTVIGAKSISVSGTRMDSEILPLFPLGGIVYTPNSEHILNIFEPRYRQMYNDILMNGTKRFVVSMSHPTERGRFAQTGVLFELQELKDVSDQTADQIKYVCSHRVTGRVKIHRVLNPQDWESRDTYLRVEGTISDDSGKDSSSKDSAAAASESSHKAVADDVYGAVMAAAASSAAGGGSPREERALRESFSDLVEIQHELEEDVRFTRASVAALAVKPGPGRDGLWQTIRLWQNFADQRLMARQNELQKDFQEKLQNFLKTEKGLKEEELPSAIGFQDLSPALQQEVTLLQKRMAVELQPLVLESQLSMQKLLEATDHKERCKLLRYFVDAERRRLNAKKTLRGMFAGTSSTSNEPSMPREESMSDDKKSSKSIFTDEPDAFQ